MNLILTVKENINVAKEKLELFGLNLKFSYERGKEVGGMYGIHPRIGNVHHTTLGPDKWSLAYEIGKVIGYIDMPPEYSLSKPGEVMTSFGVISAAGPLSIVKGLAFQIKEQEAREQCQQKWTANKI